MRHRKGNKKLSKPTDQRIALLRSLVISLFAHSRITTTRDRAKQAQRFAEKLITLGKSDTVFARRMVARRIPNKDVVKQLFSVISPKYMTRNGGYTRVLNIGPRQGDGSPMVILELVESL